jgi:hypothetical protein
MASLAGGRAGQVRPAPATLLARIAHPVPDRKPNDPIQDQSWDGQIKQHYQDVKRAEDHADLILSTSPPMDTD